MGRETPATETPDEACTGLLTCSSSRCATRTALRPEEPTPGEGVGGATPRAPMSRPAPAPAQRGERTAPARAPGGAAGGQGPAPAQGPGVAELSPLPGQGGALRFAA
jgi:hypothetical protein